MLENLLEGRLLRLHLQKKTIEKTDNVNIKKKRRYCPGVMALQEIRCYQKQHSFIFQDIPSKVLFVTSFKLSVIKISSSSLVLWVRCRRLVRPSLWGCLKTPICVLFLQNVSLLCRGISSWREGSVVENCMAWHCQNKIIKSCVRR